MTLAEAQQALDDAQEIYADAHATAERSHRRAAEIREALEAGDTSFSPGDLAQATQEAEHAELALHGAVAPLPALGEAVLRARAEEACDQVVAELPALGSAVADALREVSAALALAVEATRRFDEAAERDRRLLERVALRHTPRFEAPKNAFPRVDGIAIRPCMGHRQLIAVLLPALRAMGAEGYLLRDLKLFADAAPSIPSRKDPS